MTQVPYLQSRTAWLSQKMLYDHELSKEVQKNFLPEPNPQKIELPRKATCKGSLSRLRVAFLGSSIFCGLGSGIVRVAFLGSSIFCGFGSGIVRVYSLSRQLNL